MAEQRTLVLVNKNQQIISLILVGFMHATLYDRVCGYNAVCRETAKETHFSYSNT